MKFIFVNASAKKHWDNRRSLKSRNAYEPDLILTNK